MPNLDDDKGKKLIPIEGTPVDLLDPPRGCAFGPRCEHCMKICLTKQPPTVEVEEDHLSACWLHVRDGFNQKNDASEGRRGGNA